VRAKVSLSDWIYLLPVGNVGQVDGDLYHALRARTDRFQAGIHIGNGELKLLDDATRNTAVRCHPDRSGDPDQIACFRDVTIVTDRLRLAVQHQAFYRRHVLLPLTSTSERQGTETAER
jgi:hypothetical protein